MNFVDLDRVSLRARSQVYAGCVNLPALAAGWGPTATISRVEATPTRVCCSTCDYPDGSRVTTTNLVDDLPLRPRKPFWLRRRTLRLVLPWVVIIGLFLFWEIVVRAFDIEHPKVAVVPILVIWFGVGTIPAIITAFLIAFFPILVNVAVGIATVEPELQDVLRALGANRWQVIKKVGLPRSMPYFFASLKVAITFAFVGTIVAETVAANKGIGNLMLVASSRFEVPLAFAGLLMTSVMGIGMYLVTALLERRMTGWATRGADGMIQPGG
jgi:ABC-type nitrate/sulfonate/bicarbonate transport system permease component